MIDLPIFLPRQKLRQAKLFHRYRMFLFAGFCLSLFLLSLGRASAQNNSETTVLWVGPPNPNHQGLPLRELFEHPEQWRQSRARIYGIQYADHGWAEFADEDLRKWFIQLKRWGLKSAMEVGALKPWGTTGAIAFQKSRRNWDRLIADGAQFDAIALDEPLRCALCDLHQTPGYAVEETAQYIALVRANYPDWKIGDIEPYPNTENLIQFIDALQARLKQMHVRGLDFFRLDVDYMNFKPGAVANIQRWREVVALERKCRNRGIPFSLICWAADYNLLKKQGLATDMTWHDSIMRQGQAYREAGGRPSEYVIQSWLGVPLHSVPERSRDSYMWSVLDFADRYVPKLN